MSAPAGKLRFAAYGLGVGATLALIVVSVAALTSDDDSARAAIRECTGADAVNFDCYEQRYVEMVRADGVAPALAVLAAEQQRNGYVRGACHQLTHRIGRAAGEISGIAALEQATPLCASGYYHGVTQAVMSEIGAGGAIDEAAAVCEELRASEAFSSQHYNCVHGLGHGFMAVNGSDVFESLDGCDRALDDDWERDKCYGGVFMENVTAINNPDRPSQELRPNQPLYPCTVVSARYKPQCYDWQMAYAVLVSDGDFDEIFELCDQTETAFRDSCYEGIGGDALQQSKFLTDEAARWETLRELCLLRPDAAARAGCIDGAITAMYRDYTDGAEQAQAFCEALAAAGDHTEHAVCLDARERADREVPLPGVEEAHAGHH